MQIPFCLLVSVIHNLAFVVRQSIAKSDHYYSACRELAIANFPSLYYWPTSIEDNVLITPVQKHLETI